MRIIGDVHGNIERYLNAIDDSDSTIQIGDMGFNYDHMRYLNYFKHVFFRGNHDRVDNLPLNCFLNYGNTTFNKFPFFFISGGYSIDKERRTEGVDWWSNEELTYKQLQDCIELYRLVKPDIVLSHEAPITAVSDKDYFPTDILECWGYDRDWHSKTSHALQSMFDIHKPKVWIFGHHHVWYNKVIDGTKFICIPECGWIDINNNGDVIDRGQC